MLLAHCTVLAIASAFEVLTHSSEPLVFVRPPYLFVAERSARLRERGALAHAQC